MKRKLLKFTAGLLTVSVLTLNVKAALGDAMESNFSDKSLAASESFDEWDSSSTTSGSSSSSTSGTSASGSGDSGSSGINFDAEHPFNVSCGAVTWERTTFFGASGQIVGQTLIQNGVIKASYTGSYTSSTTSSGTIEPRTSTGMDCYGWGLGCTPKSAVDACQ